MKKIALIVLGACMFIGTAKAQKQAGNEKNLQVLFAPLGGNPISLNYGGISFRKFNATGDAAWRVNFFFGMNNTTEVTGQPVDTGSFSTGGGVPELDKKTSGMTFSIRPGYEKHFAGTEKLSPYIGAELAFTLVTDKVEEDNLATNGTNTAPATDYVVLTTTKEGEKGSTTFGVNLIAGFDYYFAKNLSLGAEFGFGFSTTSHPDVTSESVVVNPTTGASEVKANADEIQGSSMNIGPNAIAQIKLGWLF
jgi:hypothetical protein